MNTDHKIDYSEDNYKSVAASTRDVSTGVTIPNNEKIAVARVWLNGADPDAYVYLVWDDGGGAEKIIISSKGDIDHEYDLTNSDVQFTGNGTKKMQLIIDNNDTNATPIIGGGFELTVIP
jgi:hypothetical protein